MVIYHSLFYRTVCHGSLQTNIFSCFLFSDIRLSIVLYNCKSIFLYNFLFSYILHIIYQSYTVYFCEGSVRKFSFKTFIFMFWLWAIHDYILYCSTVHLNNFSVNTFSLLNPLCILLLLHIDHKLTALFLGFINYFLPSLNNCFLHLDDQLTALFFGSSTIS